MNAELEFIPSSKWLPATVFNNLGDIVEPRMLLFNLSLLLFLVEQYSRGRVDTLWLVQLHILPRILFN